ncbi:hypothetical protein FRX31_025022 [Thalictrum thalictroides]|uniref:Uncharacterized protein n=1 Tax=Thalictrum thalictroides TaxID=46969 RepID=A0A7J6VKW0_THATH|nr:hypothetical protein FRX31_025022 [Thalictrum thalictroides]
MMTCSNCKQTGQNKKGCKNPRFDGRQTTTSHAEQRPKKRKEKPPGGYGVHTFEDGTQYIRLPGWKRGKYFDPRSVQASPTNTNEGVQVSQASTRGGTTGTTSTRGTKARGGKTPSTRVARTAPSTASTRTIISSATTVTNIPPGIPTGPPKPPPKPQSKAPPKPKANPPSFQISQRTRTLLAAAEPSTGTNNPRSKTLGTVSRVWRR